MIKLKMLKADSLDNINSKVLDYLVKTYKDDKNYRIMDERKTISFSEKREYFLFSKLGQGINEPLSVEFTFIWIGPNLWKFSYLNIHCTNRANWVDPLILLNDLIG